MAKNLLETIYESYRQGLYSLALSITGCQSSAEDAIHQAFSRMSSEVLSTKDDATAYVFRAVRNASIDSRRRQSRNQKFHESIFNGYIPPSESTFENPDTRVLTAERNQILRKAIDELQESPRQAILLRTYSGLTFKQIGTVLGIPTKTAATQYRRALSQLEQRLKGKI